MAGDFGGPNTPPPLPSGTRIGRYILERRIGSGGMASVYEAKHEALDKRVALKALHPTFAAHEPSVERFLLEARAASKLSHPHVVSVSDVGLDNGTPYMVMEYLEGEALADQLDRLGALPVQVVADLMLPVMSAVGAAHAAGIIHRDLKPENIFLALDSRGVERPVLLDFGISKVRTAARPNTSLTVAGQLMGTPHYMSPEQIREPDEIDERSDQYALGVILYECATGLRPFRTEQSLYLLLAEIMLGNPEPPTRLRPGLSQDFERVILRAMAAHRENRFSSLRSLGMALFPFASPAVQSAWESEFGGGSTEFSLRPGAMRPGTLRSLAPSLRPDAGRGEELRPERRAARVQPSDLRVIEALSECSDAELEMFCVVAPSYLYPAGSELFRQGDQGESCLLLLRGSTEVVKHLPSGGDVINRLHAGAVVGQVALVDRSPRSASVIAREDTLAVELAREVFQRLLDAHNRIAVRFQEQVAVAGIRQLRTATTRLAELLEARARADASGAQRSGETNEHLQKIQLAAEEWAVSLDPEERVPTKVRVPKS